MTRLMWFSMLSWMMTWWLTTKFYNNVNEMKYSERKRLSNMVWFFNILSFILSIITGIVGFK